MLYNLRVSYLVLLTFLTLSVVLLQPAATPLAAVLTILAMQIAPLALFAPAIWRKNSYGLLVLTLLVLVYMGFATMNCFLHGLKQTLALIELVLEAWLIMACYKAVKSQPRGHGAL